MPNKENLIPAKKGEVRNPKGKPKGTLNRKTVIENIAKTMAREVTIEVPGGSKEKVSLLEAQFLKIANQAIRKGDYKCTEFLLNYAGLKPVEKIQHSDDPDNPQKKTTIVIQGKEVEV